MMNSEYSSVQVHTDGTATIKVGTSGHGQGHPTTFGMIVSDRLGIPLDMIRFVQSDTEHVPRGGGTAGSRSLQLGGSAVYRATERVWHRSRRLAADILEANPDDIVVIDDARVGVTGSPASAIGWPAIAEAAEAAGDPLVEELDLVQDGSTFPFGAHIAVVEVDMETGHVRHVRHVAIDDCGRIVNPMIVEGQQHGGIASGAAQVLWEHFVYDADGNPLTTSLAEYEMPSAAELPSFETANTQTPTHLNPLGAKGIGESGTIGAMPAVHNAVIDALSHLGIRHIDMPCTPERVWRAIDAAQRGSTPAIWHEPRFDFATLPVPNDGQSDPRDISL
jgi:carbon-monoxide dehydrogenase large subunit